MTAETAPVQARVTIGRPAGPGSEREARLPSLPDRLAGYGIWVAVVARLLGDRRFQAGAVTRVLGAYALGSLVKNNQARPVRRAVAWYNVRGRIHHVEVLHDARRQAEPDKRQGVSRRAWNGVPEPMLVEAASTARRQLRPGLSQGVATVLNRYVIPDACLKRISPLPGDVAYATGREYMGE